MLPLVLGGIALAAVGYGVKEYCESEGCPWDEEVESKLDKEVNVFELLQKQKTALYENKLLKLRVLLLQIENVDERLKFKDTVKIHEEKLSDNELEDDVELYVSMYKDMLNLSSDLFDSYIHIVEDILTSKTKYESLDKSERKIVKQAYKVVNTGQKLVGLRVLDVHVLNINVISTLKSLKVKLDHLALEDKTMHVETLDALGVYHFIKN